MTAWLDENCGSDGWAMTRSGMRGVLKDAISLYFADATLASAFVARWCVGSKAETAGGVFQVREDEPAPRVWPLGLPCQARESAALCSALSDVKTFRADMQIASLDVEVDLDHKAKYGNLCAKLCGDGRSIRTSDRSGAGWRSDRHRAHRHRLRQAYNRQRGNRAL
jgi:hypothetical protein